MFVTFGGTAQEKLSYRRLLPGFNAVSYLELSVSRYETHRFTL